MNLEKGLITLIYGPAASGKTTIALETTLKYAEKGRVLFIDSEEGFSIDRLKQMNPECEEILDNVVVVNVKDFNEQVKAFDNLEMMMKVGNFEIIIIDTMGMQYRKALQEGDYQYVNEKILTGLRKLSNLASEYKIPILILNQIYTKMNGENVGVGGNLVKNFGKYLIELKVDPRRAVVLKPFEKIIHFEINDFGIKRL